MENQDAKNQIEKRMQEIYQQYDNKKGVGNESVEDITFFKDLTLIEAQEEMGIAEQDVYAVKKTDQMQRVQFDLYTYVWNRETNSPERMLIASIDERGVLQFTDQYLKNLEEIDMAMQRKEEGFGEIARRSNRQVTLELPEDIEEGDIRKTGKELEEEKLPGKEEESENKEGKSEAEQDLEKIADLTGDEIGSITSYSQINPNRRVTENDTLGKLIGAGDQYSKIYVVRATSETKQHGKFAFVGIDQSGKATYVNELETRGTTVTGRNVFAMDRDGRNIEEKQVTEMFATKDPNKILSVTIGNYGILDVDYIRRDPVDNQFVSSPIETEHHRPTDIQVRKMMDERNVSTRQLDAVTDKIEHQTEEYGSNQTNITQIDPHQLEEEKYDIDDTIDMREFQEGEDTTLRKEAERLNMNIEQYLEEIRQAEGDCTADKIQAVREKHPIEQENEEEQEQGTESLVGEVAEVAGVAAVAAITGKAVMAQTEQTERVEPTHSLFEPKDRGEELEEQREERGERKTPEEMAAEIARRRGII